MIDSQATFQRRVQHFDNSFCLKASLGCKEAEFIPSLVLSLVDEGFMLIGGEGAGPELAVKVAYLGMTPRGRGSRQYHWF